MNLPLSAHSLDAIYDVTIGYPDVVPEEGEADVARGEMPNEVNFAVKR